MPKSATKKMKAAASRFRRQAPMLAFHFGYREISRIVYNIKKYGPDYQSNRNHIPFGLPANWRLLVE